MASVNVIISGKSYRMACDDGQEEHLLGLAADLNATIDGLRAAVGEIGDQRLTVMAAITMADGLSEAKRRLDRVEAELATMKREAKMAADRQERTDDALADRLATAADRISEAARRLNAGAAG